MNRSDLQKLSTIRLQEANTLFEAREYSGAYYLAGYAVECALKARIASFTQQYDFPAKKTVQQAHTHSLEDLIKFAKLDSELKKRTGDLGDFEDFWGKAKEWSEEARYREYSREKAEALLTALLDPDDGVMTWLKLFW